MEKFDKITRTYENCLRQQSLSKTKETPQKSEQISSAECLKDSETSKPVNVPFGTKLLPLTTMVLPMALCTGLSSPGKPGVPWQPQILADQFTLSQPAGVDYTHHITTGSPGISDLPTSLSSIFQTTKPLKMV